MFSFLIRPKRIGHALYSVGNARVERGPQKVGGRITKNLPYTWKVYRSDSGRFVFVDEYSDFDSAVGRARKESY